MIRILIADDHAIMRKGIIEILRTEYPDVIIGEASDSDNLLSRILAEPWDVVISDLNMPGTNYFDALKQIKKTHPALPVLVMSMAAEDQYAIRVIKAGASGFLAKVSIHDNLINAITVVLQGRKFITPAIAEQLADSLNEVSVLEPLKLLSDREFDVLKMLASGKPISEIAKQLGLSPTTVSTYRSRIMEKMKMKSNAELTRFALERNLI
ncbi:MAG: two component transcriptional regulator, LuxR family [Chitinophagaceae bacterium]|nr:two component transcriptional regulator, LuxR family [Chitinophagaceae bacterium]